MAKCQCFSFWGKSDKIDNVEFDQCVKLNPQDYPLPEHILLAKCDKGEKMNTQSTQRFAAVDLAKIGLVAAIYVVLTVTPPLNNLAYGPLQFRLSEILNFLPFYNKRYIWGVTIGCFLSNFFSPNVAAVDVIVGTAQTLICLLIGIWLFEHVFQKRYLPSFVAFIILDAVGGMAIIAAELLLVYKDPFLLMWTTIGAGEVAVLIVGAIIIGLLGKKINLTR